MLRDLRLSAFSWTRRPIGRLASMLLLVALVLAGAPRVTVHTHEAGGRDHSHDATASVVAHAGQYHDERDHHDDEHVDQDRHGHDPDPTGTLSVDTVLHLHDVGTLVLTLPAVPALTLPEMKFATLDAGLPATSPPTAARTPPHRPPIA